MSSRHPSPDGRLRHRGFVRDAPPPRPPPISPDLGNEAARQRLANLTSKEKPDLRAIFFLIAGGSDLLRRVERDEIDERQALAQLRPRLPSEIERRGLPLKWERAYRDAATAHQTTLGMFTAFRRNMKA